MAIRFPVLGDGLERTTGSFLSGNADFTVMFWVFQVGSVPTGNNYRAYQVLADSGYNQYVGIYSQSDLSDLGLSGNDSGDFGSPYNPVIIKDAYHVCYVYDNTAKTLKTFINRALVDEDTGVDFSSTTFTQEFIGYDGGSFNDLAVQNYRSWQRKLTFAEICLDSASDTAVLLTNLFCDTPLHDASDLADISGNSRDWVAVGTPTNYTINDIDFLATLTNTAAISAQNFTAVDTSGKRLVQDVFDGGILPPVWFKYTATAAQQVIGIRAFGNYDFDAFVDTYDTSISIFTGPDTAPVQYLNFTFTPKNKPVIIPVISGETYYFKVQYSGFAPTTTAILTFQISQAPSGTAPAGAIFVNNDLDSYPAGFINSTQDDNLYTFIANIASGEAGDTFNAGEVILSEEHNGNYWKFYNNQFQFQSNINFPYTNNSGRFPSARTNRTSNLIYLAYSGKTSPLDNAKVTTVNSSGILGATIWDLGIIGVVGIAAKQDDTILYYGGTGTSDNIYRWDLIGNTGLGLFITGISGYIITDILTLENDTIVVAYTRGGGSPSNIVRTYNSAGVQLQSITMPSGDGRLMKLFFDYPSATHFWVFYHRGFAFNIFVKILASSAATITTIEQPEFEDGYYSPSVTNGPWPETVFGVSESCPAFLIRAAFTSPTTGVIIVDKTQVGGTPQSFDFNINGGLSPATFSLADGESQEFSSVAAGTYSITEDPVSNFNQTFDVSNGDPHTAIDVAAGETVIVTVTNTFEGINPLSGIYKIEPNSFKTNDTLYTSLDPKVTEDSAIPRPFARTGLLGE